MIEISWLRYFLKQRQLTAGLDYKEADIIDDITVSVPLFRKDGNNYRWSHKSIQDYFAAQFICTDSKDRQGGIMKKLYINEDGKFYNVLDICYDIDYVSFRKHIVYDLSKRYIDYVESSYKNMDDSISKDEIRFRQEVSFGKLIVISMGKCPLDKYSKKEEQSICYENVTRDLYKSIITSSRLKDIPRGRVSATRWRGPEQIFVMAWEYQGMLSVIDILYAKKSNIVKSVRVKNIRPSVEHNYDHIPAKDVLVVDDDPNNILNSNHMIFSMINNMIAAEGRYGIYGASNKYLDYNKCKSEIAKIEKEISISEGFMSDMP